jgi:hypothetical protein
VVYDGTIRDGGDYAFASHNGGIWVVVPDKAGMTVSVSTFNGELHSSLPITFRGETGSRRRMNFVFGNGSARIDIESFGGDVYLRRPGEAIPADITPRVPKPPKPPKLKN